MIVAYCFIGPLPEYALDTVHQMRLFYKDPIYFIISDTESPYCKELNTLDVTIIPYNTVLDNNFIDCVNANDNKFDIIHGLQGREKLFIYSFERFAVLNQMMLKYNLTDVFFLELDNLIYDDPLKWVTQFSLKEMAYMYDKEDRCCSGIAFIKNTELLTEFVTFCITFINTTTKYVSEMGALYEFWLLHKDRIQMLPTHWPSQVSSIVHEHYHLYQSVFDSAPMGVYLGGYDPYHTQGIIKKGLKWPGNDIDYTQYQYKWEKDVNARNIPYVLYEDTWIRINNLHIHSKDLVSNLSQPRINMSHTHNIIHSICHPELVKEIQIEHEELITGNEFHIGIVIPTFNRPEYLKYTLFSLSRSNLTSRKLIVLIFDDGSAECTEQIIRSFTLDIPIIKIFSNKINIVHQNDYTILPGNAFPYTIRYGCEILFSLGAKYVMNSDSDAMFCSNWLSIIDNTLMHIHDEQFILAGFRCDDKFHKVTYEGNHYSKLATLGGINYLCNRHTFFNTIQSCIYDYAFDWIVSSICEQKHITIYLTKQSIVQHIGVHSSIIRGANNYLSQCYECNIADITLEQMMTLDNAVKQLSDFPHANNFNLGRTLFDIVIPVGPNDYNRIHDTILYTKRNVLHYRNIYIVSANPITIDGCTYVPETIFPFTLSYIESLNNCKEKAGWYLQQLIKLYAGTYILGILPQYLVLDADVYVVKPTTFMRDEKPLYAIGNEHHMPYFNHMMRLHSSFVRQTNISGICHHMMFTQKYLQELFALVENDKPFWMRFLYEVQESGSGASEYEIYFNFMLVYHKNDMIIRNLCWRDISKLDEVGPEHDLVALHHYLAPVISVNIMGGLGNQLFQIAAAYSYAKQHNAHLQILNKKDNGDRPFYWDTILSNMKPYLVESLPILEQWYEDSATTYKLISPKNKLYLNGYLQSSKYHIPEIKELFKIRLTPIFPVEGITGNAVHYLLANKYNYLLSNKRNVVVMHSRQTDYQLKKEFHGPLDISYYERALKKMTEYVQHPFLVLCGDDNTFWNGMNLQYPHIILKENDINTFALLQQFHHYIISNSSFIWWCTYLADAKNVIAPAKWFGPTGPQQYEDIYEPSWIRL